MSVTADDELIRAALAKVGDVSQREMARQIGIERSSIRQWLAATAAGLPLPPLTAPGRDAVRAYLADTGERARSADYWRGVVAMAERQARALADSLADELAGVTPPGAADDPTRGAADAMASLPTPSRVVRRRRA